MIQTKNHILRVLIVATITLLFLTKVTFGQKKIDPGDKLVFVYYEKYPKNFILIPNVGKLHSFKIYRKLKSESDSSFKFMAERKKPPLPMRANSPAPWGVNWEDPDYHSRDIDYKVLAFDKDGNELCQMQIIWEEEKGKPDTKQEENKTSSDTLKKH